MRSIQLLSAIGFAATAVALAFALGRFLVGAPGYTDAFYHFNVANRLVTGDGFVDDYLWSYIDAPESLPTPSHRYWMPLPSLLAALGMALFAAPFSYNAAQSLFLLLAAGAGMVAFGLALRLNGKHRQAWIAGLLTVMGGYFAPRWGAIDTFAPYALIGSLALLCIGLGISTKRNRLLLWALAGIFSGLAQLTRVDGLFILLSAAAVILSDKGSNADHRKAMLGDRFSCLAILLLCYGATMLPWFLRNLEAIGSIMPSGGIQTVWFSDYAEFFSYPSDVSPESLFAAGLQPFLAVRWTASANGLATLIGVEGIIVLAPFMLIGFWRRRNNPLLRGFWIFALAIHLVMCLVFPLQGYRGGLFHAVAALYPFWMVLGVLGMDDTVKWICQRRTRWNPASARHLFALTGLLYAVLITLVVALPARVTPFRQLPDLYEDLRNSLPQDARVMVNDPARLYYFLGMGGVPLANEPVEVIVDIARKYDIDYLLLEGVQDDGLVSAAPPALQFELDDPLAFLRPIPLDRHKAIRLYEIAHD